MTTKVVVHSTTQRLLQVIGLALLIAAALVGLKRFSEWWKATPAVPAASASTPSAPQLGSPSGLIVGEARVIDGDTIVIHGQHIRLEGIDAPETAQRCGTPGHEWACGQDASVALSNWLANQTVSCSPKGKDRYQRTLAQCFLGSDDIQARLVSNGWALAYRKYSSEYVSAEDLAKSKKIGLWQGDFQAPWDWRKAHR
jgi:endonuclease YncB( thermonuclease family)